MWIYIEDRPKLLLVLLLGVWVLLNIFSSFGAEISGSEAYLWYVSRDLDWGYVDSSPLGVFCAWLGFNVMGETLFGLRLLFILAQGVALYLFYEVVRKDGDSARSVLLYFLIALSIPLLHINGFLVLSDQLLMLAMVIAFWVYSKFLVSSKWWWPLMLGLSWALVAYVGLQGLLIVPAILGSNTRSLRSFRIYLAMIVCVGLLIPEVWWQYTHDWPILASHVALNDGYSLSGTLSGLALAALRFNPLVVLGFLMITLGRKREGDEEPMIRLMRNMFWICVALVVYTSSRGVSPSLSAIPMLFPLLFVLVRSTEFRGTYRRYLFLATSFSATLIIGLRLFVVVDTYGVASGEIRTRALVDTLTKSGVRMVVFNDSPLSASMVDFYDTLPSNSMVSSRAKIDQYALSDVLNGFYAKKVAVQLPNYAIQSISWDSLAKHFISVRLPEDGQRGYFQIVDRYIPTGALLVEPAVLPEKVLTDSRIAITLTIVNPYSYGIELGGTKGRYAIVMQLKSEPTGDFYDIILPLKDQLLSAGAQAVVGTTALIPTVPTGTYSIVFTIRHFPQPSAANSDRYTIQIINPKSRI